MVLSSNTSAITSSSAQNLQATTSKTTASTKRWKISLSSPRPYRSINDNYLDVQQDILETFIDRGQLRKLAEPTITCTGKRIPGLKLDHPRQLALMHALVRFAHIAAANTFTTAEIHPAVIEALGCAPDHYTLASLRYDLSKLRQDAHAEDEEPARNAPFLVILIAPRFPRGLVERHT
jgi:hypothetical protein